MPLTNPETYFFLMTFNEVQFATKKDDLDSIDLFPVKFAILLWDKIMGLLYDIVKTVTNPLLCV